MRHSLVSVLLDSSLSLRSSSEWRVAFFSQIATFSLMDYIQFEQEKKKIFLCDMRPWKGSRFSGLVEKGVAKVLRSGKRVVIIAPKKWYAAGVICQDCGHIPTCDHCSAPIAYHKDHQGHFVGMCHLCKKQYPTLWACVQCHGFALQAYGMGVQQVAEWIGQTFGIQAGIIQREVANSPRKVTTLLQQLADAPVVIGTSLLYFPAKSVDADLVVVLAADQGLYIPDRQANRQTFCTLHTMIQAYQASTFLLQTYAPEHPVLQFVAKGDTAWMRAWEWAQRKSWGYPPYGELCVLLYKHEIEQRVYTSVHKLYQELLFLQQQNPAWKDISITSTPPLIYKMYNKFRYHLIIRGPDIREFVRSSVDRLQVMKRGFKVDWEPMHIV